MNIVDTDDSQLKVTSVPLHNKVDLGNKPLIKERQVIVEKQDIEGMKAGDKMVLLKWGVFEIVKRDDTTFDIKYLPEDKDFKNPPKLTWLS